MDATAALQPRAERAPLNAWPLGMLGVLAIAAVLFAGRLGERALWSEEVRWLQIPREMQQSGDYLWPTINGQTYYDKPLGSYWLVLLSSYVTGCLDEHAARLPSAVSGLIAVAMLMLIARRFAGDACGLLAGLILASSFSFVFFARTASTDVETVAGILTALWIFLKYEDRPSPWWLVSLWLVMALTSLTKGLLGFALPVLIIIACSALQSSGSYPQRLLASVRWLVHPIVLLAIPMAAVVYLAPFLLSIAIHGSSDGLDMVYRENIRRFFDPVNHRGPVYLYTWVIFMLLAPWSLLLPAALVHAHWSADKQGKGRAFALAYFWATFLFFTLSASRRSYYLLPILPAAALLIAQMLTAPAPLRPVATWLMRGAFAILSITVIASGSALSPIAAYLPDPWNRLPALPSPAWFALAWLVSSGAAAYGWLKLEPRRICCAFGVTAVAFMLYLYVGALPELEAYRTQKPFIDAVKVVIQSAPDQVGLHGTREIVGYLDASAPIAEYRGAEEMQAAVRSEQLRWLIVRRRDWEQLHLNGTIVVAETMQPWEDAATAQAKLLLIELHGP